MVLKGALPRKTQVPTKPYSPSHATSKCRSGGWAATLTCRTEAHIENAPQTKNLAGRTKQTKSKSPSNQTPHPNKQKNKSAKLGYQSHSLNYLAPAKTQHREPNAEITPRRRTENGRMLPSAEAKRTKHDLVTPEQPKETKTVAMGQNSKRTQKQSKQNIQTKQNHNQTTMQNNQTHKKTAISHPCKTEGIKL